MGSDDFTLNSLGSSGPVRDIRQCKTEHRHDSSPFTLQCTNNQSTVRDRSCSTWENSERVAKNREPLESDKETAEAVTCQFHKNDVEPKNGDAPSPNGISENNSPPRHNSAASASFSRTSVDSELASYDHHEFGSTDPGKYVTLHIEHCSQRQLKMSLLVVYLGTIVGIGSLIWLFVVKLTKDDEFMFRHARELMTANICVATVNILLLGVGLSTALWRSILAWKKGLIWGHRRRRFLLLLAAECVTQWMNSLFYLLPNVVALSSACRNHHYFVFVSASLRWVSWTTIWTTSLFHTQNIMPLDVPTHDVTLGNRLLDSMLRWGVILNQWQQRIPPQIHPDKAMVLDLPLWVHAPKLGLWVSGVALSIAIGVIEINAWSSLAVANPPLTDFNDGVAVVCPNGGGIKCQMLLSLTIVSSLLMGLFVSMGLMLLLWQFAVGRQLARKPYAAFRMANITHQIMRRNRCTVFSFIGSSVALLWYAKLVSCNTFFFGTYGFMPMQIAVSVFLSSLLWLYMPEVGQSSNDSDQSLLRKCAWTEKQQEGMHQAKDLKNESLFCFETMLKLLYWSYMVYESREQAQTYTVEMALQMFGVHEFAEVCDQATATKAVLGWGPQAIVLAFRGTTSMENVLTDAKIWLTPHPPVRGTLWLGTQPRVHEGFYSAWSSNGYNTLLIGRLREILSEMRDSGGFPRVYVTGHSLGGALATLAAYEIARELSEYVAGRLTCYTFGCPRVGNRSFCRDCHGLVQDTWHVINDNDIVTRNLKMFGLYKRTPKRMLMFPSGTMIVRPNFLEISIFKNIFGGEVSQHLLSVYILSIREVIVNQYTVQHSKAARRGLSALMAQDAMQQFFDKYLGLNTYIIRDGLTLCDRLVQRDQIVRQLDTNPKDTEDGSRCGFTSFWHCKL